MNKFNTCETKQRVDFYHRYLPDDPEHDLFDLLKMVNDAVEIVGGFKLDSVSNILHVFDNVHKPLFVLNPGDVLVYDQCKKQRSDTFKVFKPEEFLERYKVE